MIRYDTRFAEVGWRVATEEASSLEKPTTAILEDVARLILD